MSVGDLNVSWRKSVIFQRKGFANATGHRFRGKDLRYGFRGGSLCGFLLAIALSLDLKNDSVVN